MKDFKMNKIAAAVLALGLIVTADTSFAAFGSSRASSSGVGVSRSYTASRPTTTYSRPAATPSAPPASTYSRPATPPPASSYSTAPRSTYSAPASNYNSGYNQRSYNQNQGFNTNYNNPQRNSTMRDIGVTAAGVGGGILAASAIQHLLSAPGHPGYYTHPQYPGQYFTGSGVPVSPQQVDQGYMPPAGQEQAQNQGYIQPQPSYPVQQQSSGRGFFGTLWSILGGIIELIFFIALVAALAFAGWKGWQYLKPRVKEVVDNKGFNSQELKMELSRNAQEIFYDFQKNSDNEAWVKSHTKYLDFNTVKSPASTVLKYEQGFVEVALEQGKIRASVRYTADLTNVDGEEHIDQYWNFEKEDGIWKVIGVEPVL